MYWQCCGWLPRWEENARGGVMGHGAEMRIIHDGERQWELRHTGGHVRIFAPWPITPPPHAFSSQHGNPHPLLVIAGNHYGQHFQLPHHSHELPTASPLFQIFCRDRCISSISQSLQLFSNVTDPRSKIRNPKRANISV